MVGAVLALALVVAAVVILLRRRSVEAERAERTRLVVTNVASFVRELTFPVGKPPLARGEPLDPDGQVALSAEVRTFFTFVPDEKTRRVQMVGVGGWHEVSAEVWMLLEGRETVRDAWGRPLRYRCPGPVHHRGFDVYSLGADGEDDGGRGDDILEGTDCH